MSRKTVFLMEYPIDLPGGGQVSTKTLCEGLMGSEYEPVVICPKLLKPSESRYPFKVLTYPSFENREDKLPKRIINFALRMRAFYRLICEEKPDIVHVSMSESLLTYGLIRGRKKLRDIPFVYTDRGLCYGYRSHTKFLMRRILKHAAAMICTTSFNRSLWEKEELPVKIRVIHNTIGNAFSAYDEDKRNRLRKEKGLTESDLVIGFAGRISEEKDWDLVPVLVKKLKEAGISFKVALVISVYENKDTEIVNGIKKGITDAISEDCLIYMQDLSQEDMADYYYLVDVFVMSSMFESFGKAAVEAMSRKCSVVSTSVGGLTEVIGKEDNLYTKDDLTKFTERIKKLYNDRGELDKDREFFYERYRENFTPDIHIKRHIGLYDEVLSR
ncbi:MAG: glycosyltransferase family 4 protein [Lachnospiraceae bacterium]|nr:glycosyltransferase family 4 protein [Lachnospiraceae bacterium]